MQKKKRREPRGNAELFNDRLCMGSITIIYAARRKLKAGHSRRLVRHGDTTKWPGCRPRMAGLETSTEASNVVDVGFEKMDCVWSVVLFRFYYATKNNKKYFS